MIPRKTGNIAYAKFWVDKQRVLWYFLYWLIVFLFFFCHLKLSNVVFDWKYEQTAGFSEQITVFDNGIEKPEYNKMERKFSYYLYKKKRTIYKTIIFC